MTSISYKKHRTPEQDARLRERRRANVRAYDAAVQARKAAAGGPRTMKRSQFDALSPAERVATVRSGVVVED